MLESWEIGKLESWKVGKLGSPEVGKLGPTKLESWELEKSGPESWTVFVASPPAQESLVFSGYLLCKDRKM